MQATGKRERGARRVHRKRMRYHGQVWLFPRTAGSGREVEGGEGGRTCGGLSNGRERKCEGRGKKRGEENNSVGEETARGKRAMSGV